MEGALVRNLSDTAGNSLVHILCCLGHLSCLSWLLQHMPLVVPALLDENVYGQTPVLCAIKVRVSMLLWQVSKNSNTASI